MVQARAIVTMEGKWDTVPKLTNGTSFNGFERPITRTSRLLIILHWISQKWYEILTYLQGNTDRIYSLLKSVISNDLEWLSEIFSDMWHRMVSLWELSCMLH